MKIAKTITAVRAYLSSRKRKGKTVGFVPTMGALHEGHLSLVRRARQENDIVVVSIFVNPIQFGPREDLRKYPQDLKRDVKRLDGLCDLLFVPSEKEMYREGFCSFVEVRGTGDLLCGARRKGHFTGVATVVAKLFHIVEPAVAYFGQKDAQQAVVIRKMAGDLDFPVKITVCPIVREEDGLAMSSRNAYLSPKERSEAVVLFQALKSAERMAAAGARDAARIIETLRGFISRTESARIDYLEVVDKKTLEPVKTIKQEALLLLAVYIGSTRLIDNILLKCKRSG